MVNVSVSEFVTLLVVTFWLRCFQSCVLVLNEECGIKERKLAELSLNMLQEMYVVCNMFLSYTAVLGQPLFFQKYLFLF